MNRRTAPLILILAVALIAVAALTSCGAGDAATTGESAVELKIYEVPEFLTDDLESQLRSLLHRDEGAPTGRVTRGPRGTLLVLASPGIHAGIRDLVRQFGDLEAPPTEPGPIRLTYWILAGRTLSADESADRPYRIAGPRRVHPVESVLIELAGLDGPSEFTVLERIELTSSGNRWVTANGRTTGIRQRTTRLPGGAFAEIHLETGPNGLGTELRLEPGRTLVLGQAGYGGRPIEAFGDHDRDEVTLYYVLTSDL